MKKVIIALVGPSGSGKSTTEAQLQSIKKMIGNKKEISLGKIISHTSRCSRIGERDGVDYHYVSKDFFNENEEDFLEIVNFGDNFYGVHKESLISDISILVVEPGGLIQIQKYSKKNDIKVISIYLDISIDTQIQRMLSRGDSEEMVKQRLSFDTIAEMAKEVKFDVVLNTETLTQDIIVSMIRAIIKDVAWNF